MHVVYTKKEEVDTAKFFLENYSTGFPHDAKFVPFELRRIRPDIFGRSLYNSIQKKMQFRNIAICRVSPTMMEYSSSDLNDTLIEKLFNLPGVVQVDTHTRTPTLGKWNIAVD